MSQHSSEKRVYLRQWVGQNVKVVSAGQLKFHGRLTNLAFEGQNRLMYIMLDDKVCVNFDQIVEISLDE